MKTVRVKWCDEDLKSAMISLGYEPTAKNIKNIKEHRLIKNVEEAMTRAGWEAIEETISLAMQD